MTFDEQQIENAAAIMSQSTHWFWRQIKYLFTGKFDTETCDVCRKRASKAFNELERMRSVTTGESGK